MSKSQLGQENKIIQFYKEKKEGFFLEIGASDGIYFSNTYLLETKYNWKGICVEPIPSKYQKLLLNRPDSKCSNKAVFHTSGENVTFDIANNFDLLSGISIYIDSHKGEVEANKTQIQVVTITLKDLLDEFQAPKFIEYLSLDTEGTEYEILKIFDFTSYIFGCIDVEHNFIEPRRSQIKDLLTSNGYVYIGENQWDDSYKHSSLCEKPS